MSTHPAAPDPAKHKARRLGTLSLLSASAVVAGFLVYGVENFRGWYQWKGQRDRLIAAGQKLRPLDFVPPPIPDERNFAAIPVLRPLFEFDPSPLATNRWRDPAGFRRAMDLLSYPKVDGRLLDPDVTSGHGNWARGQSLDLAAFQEAFRHPKRRNDRQTLEQRYGLIPGGVDSATNAPPLQPVLPLPPTPGTPAADTLAALRYFDTDFKLIEDGLRLGDCRFAIQYGDGYSTLLPHLALVKKFALRFRLRAVARIAAGDLPGAVADIDSMIRLADSVRDEPFLISHLVRAACYQYVVHAVWEGVIRHAWNDAQLAEIQGRMARIDLLAGLRTSLHGERAQLVELTDRLIASHEERRKYLDLIKSMAGDTGDQEREWGAIRVYLGFAPRGWLYANLDASSRVLGSLADFDPAKVSTIRKDWQAALHAEPASIRLLLHCRYFFNIGVGWGLDGSVVNGIRAHTALRLATTALGLERQRLAQGAYPPTLDQLAPGFRPSATDPVGIGEPLHYRLESPDQFRLWANGENGQNDDGTWPDPSDGVPGPGEAASGTDKPVDWVWGWPTAGTP